MNVIGGADGPTSVFINGNTTIFVVAGIAVVILLLVLILKIFKR